MKKEQVNHPSHYNLYPIEAIDMAIAIYGEEKVADFCEITAFKYRLRLGLKDDFAQDLAKEKWYLDKAKELREGKAEKLDPVMTYEYKRRCTEDDFPCESRKDGFCTYSGENYCKFRAR